jgi:hypothetical protein
VDLLVKPEILTSYIYGPTFDDAESRPFVLVFASKRFNTNKCRNLSCVTVVCKHFASYQGYLNYRWGLIGRLRVKVDTIIEDPDIGSFVRCEPHYIVCYVINCFPVFDSLEKRLAHLKRSNYTLKRKHMKIIYTY